MNTAPRLKNDRDKVNCQEKEYFSSAFGAVPEKAR